MATHDYVLANQSGSSFRTDLNNALAAVVSNNSNSSEPSTTYAYMLWVDSTNNLVKLRNSSNNGWVTLFTTAGGVDVDAASNFNEDVTFTGANYSVTWDKSADDLIFTDNAKAAFGTGSDLSIYHDGTDSWMMNTTGDLTIQTVGTGGDDIFLKAYDDIHLRVQDGSEEAIICKGDGAVELYFDNATKMATISTGVQLNDGVQACFGSRTGGDFQISHSGSHAILKNFTGDTYFYANGTAPEVGLLIEADQGVALYYNGVIKAYSTAAGFKIHGTGELTFDDNAKAIFGSQLEIYHDGTSNIILANSGAINIRMNSSENAIVARQNGSSEMYYDNDKKVYTSSNGLQFDDNVIAAFGSSNDMQIWHSPGSGGINYFYSASMSVVHQFPVGQSWTLETTAADKRIVCPDNGDATSVRIYHNGSLKIETTSSGCTVTGTVTETSDIALKTNIEPLDNVLEKLKQITGYKYQFKDTGHNSMGVTAQDVEKVFPELVHGEEGEKTLQYSGLIGALVESVKELSAKVAALEAK